MPQKILILGGTTDARQLAGKLAALDGVNITLSLAGRTESPVAQGVPVISGGFGGAEGLARYLRDEQIELLIDATHPYAARISANAAEAAKAAEVPILALRRPAWMETPIDHWRQVDRMEDAVAALGDKPRRAFLALGRNEVRVFEGAPQHVYFIRSVDPIEPQLAVPHATYILGRGPFSEAGEFDFFHANRIDAMVCKNSGGSATFAKIAAARSLDIEVVMLRRPALPDVPAGENAEDVFGMVVHALGLEKRGE